MDKLRVAVLMGGPSSEHDVSLRGGANVVDALDRKRYEVRAVLVTREGRWRITSKAVEAPEARRGSARGFDPLAADTSWREFGNPWLALAELVDWRTDVALPILHGKFGEDGTLQACLQVAGIRFAGSGVRGSAAAVDKIRTKEVLSFHGVRTPRFRILGRDDLARGRPGLADDLVGQFGTPLVVKDPLGGSSLEVRLCDDARQVMLALETLGPKAERLLVEAYARGREFTGGVLDDRERGRPTALPLVELKPKSARFFDYREKYDADGALEVCPADLPPAVEAAGRGLALEVHERLGLRGVSRTDMILEADGQFSVLEVNTMPGMTARSLIPKAAAVAGIDFPGVIDRLIRTAGLEWGGGRTPPRPARPVRDPGGGARNPAPPDRRPYNPRMATPTHVVPKSWGEEHWIVNRDYCGKKLVLKKGHRCSLHFHKVKDEVFYVIKGKVFLELGGEEHILVPGDHRHVAVGTVHRFTGLEDAEIIEFSTHHEDADSHRVEVGGAVDLATLGFS